MALQLGKNNIYVYREIRLLISLTKTAQWCLSNYPALNSKNNNVKWIAITYEVLVLYPKESLDRVINIWSIKYDVSHINFQKDSSTTQEDSPKSPKNEIGHWKEYFSKDQIDRMGRVLEEFDINIYSKDNPLPNQMA